MGVKEQAKAFSRKKRNVVAVRWTGDFKTMPFVFRELNKGSLSTGRIDFQKSHTVLRRGNNVRGLRVGDWLVMDEFGGIEVFSEELFREEYEAREE